MTEIKTTVHLTNYYHKNSGGISTSYNNLLAAAEKNQRYVRLIVPGENETVETISDFAKIYFVPARYSPIFDKRYRIMMPWQYMVKDSPIRRILLEEKPDLIEVTDKYTLSLIGAMIRTNNFKKIGRPILVHFSCERMDDNVESFLFGGSISRWFSQMVVGNYLLPSFDFHIANSHYTAAEFTDSALKAQSNFGNFCWQFFHGPRLPLSERTFVCPRGVDAVHFTPERKSPVKRSSINKKLGIPDNAKILLYAGRISPEKNVGLLLEMMRHLSVKADMDIRLLVAGDGPLTEKMASQGKRYLKGKIFLLGHLGKEELADYYANVDIFVHPNPREPFGIAPLEAMASGVPTIAPDSGGILTYATQDNAWLTKPEGREFANAVLEILSNPTLREKKSVRAVETARKNTREHATSRLFETYDKIGEIFHVNRELFTDIEAAKRFNYSKYFRTSAAGNFSQVNQE